MDSPFTVKKETAKKRITLQIGVELETLSLEQLSEATDALLDNEKIETCRVDISPTTYLPSAYIGVLMTFCMSAKEHGKSVEFQMYLKGERNIYQNGKHLNLCHICAVAFISHEEMPCDYIYGESVNISSTDKVKSLLITLIESIRGL